MLKCDPMAYAKCPTRQYCGPSAADCDFMEGSECDQFNQQVLSQPMTNGDRIRARNDHELAESIMEFVCDMNEGVEYSDNPNDWLEWLQKPAKED